MIKCNKTNIFAKITIGEKWHEINLENITFEQIWQLRIANIKSETGIKSHVEKEKITITSVFLDEKGSNHIGKPEGVYINWIWYVTDYHNQENVKQIFITVKRNVNVFKNWFRWFGNSGIGYENQHLIHWTYGD